MDLLVLTSDKDPRAVLPALNLLPHTVCVAGPSVAEFLGFPACDAVLVDGRRQPYFACELSRQLLAARRGVPTIGVIEEWVAPEVGADCAIVQLVLSAAGPAEVEARLRLAVPDRTARDAGDGGVLVVGPVEIDADTYVARVEGRELALTHVEFELLNVFALHAGRALTRMQLLEEAHGRGLDRDERTVDTHVRDLRAKLGHRHRHLIRTVRGVGYLMVRPIPLAMGPARDEP